MKYIVFLFSLLSFSQKSFDIVKANVFVEPNFEKKSVEGEVEYFFKAFVNNDTLRIDAKNMQIKQLLLNGKVIDFKYDNKIIKVFNSIKKGTNSIRISYNCQPKQCLYFTGNLSKIDSWQIFSQGQGKYTSNWIPSFDDMKEKLIFNMSIAFDRNFTVLSNGILKEKAEKNDQLIWKYQMEKPMSSYLVALAIGKFVRKDFSTKNGTPLEKYLSEKDANKFDYTYKYSQEIFDFLEQEIGVNYPWKIYRQVPVRDFLYAGMENTTTTIFSQDYVVDEKGYNDRNYINVNAHELAHHWFGDLITSTESKHHWLHEGFATYYALLAEQHVFGDDYFYHKLFESALEIEKASKVDTVPIMNEKASTLSFYKKGAWALHYMKSSIGHKIFKKVVKKYLKKYKFQNVDTYQFLEVIKKYAPNFDTDKFIKEWLLNPKFDFETAKKLVSINPSVEAYTKWSKKNIDKEKIKEILVSNLYHPLKQRIFYDMAKIPYEDKKELIEIGMNQGIEVRESILRSLTDFPDSFKEKYETFLEDKSYEMQEYALINLCKKYPNEKIKYLDQFKNSYGNNDYSLRITWLSIMLNTEGISEENKSNTYTELVNYTSEEYESFIRENAFSSLLMQSEIEPIVIENLFKGTTHHRWQFTKYCREQIRTKLKNITFRDKVENILKYEAKETIRALYEKFLKE